MSVMEQWLLLLAHLMGVSKVPPPPFLLPLFSLPFFLFFPPAHPIVAIVAIGVVVAHSILRGHCSWVSKIIQFAVAESDVKRVAIKAMEDLLALVAGQRRKRHKQLEIEQRRRQEREEQRAFMESLRQSSMMTNGMIFK